MDPPQITKAAVMSKLKLSDSQAYIALKELTDGGKLSKFGRGPTAVFKRTAIIELV